MHKTLFIVIGGYVTWNSNLKCCGFNCIAFFQTCLVQKCALMSLLCWMHVKSSVFMNLTSWVHLNLLNGIFCVVEWSHTPMHSVRQMLLNWTYQNDQLRWVCIPWIYDNISMCGREMIVCWQLWAYNIHNYKITEK